MLGEGRWEYIVDEKGRFPIPPEIRREFEAGGVWLIEPEGYAVLYALDSWKRLLKGVKRSERQQFRMTRQPMTKQMDSQWRMTIPKHIIELGKLGPSVVLLSMADDGYLKVLNKNGEWQQETGNSGSLTPFQRFEEAKKYRDEGKKVIYLSRGRKVIGYFKLEGFFVFSGQDENGITVPVIGSYEEFYPGE